MKTSIKALAQHYRVSYKALRDVISQLDASVIEVSKRGCILFDVGAFEAAIAHLPRKANPEQVSIELLQPDDADVIEAEIVEDESEAFLSQLIQAHNQNRASLQDIAKLAAIEQGKQIADLYRKTLARTTSEGVSKANQDVLGILGK